MMMNRFLKPLILTGLLALCPVISQAQMVFAHGVATNATVDATNKQWRCTFPFNSIGFCNDSTNIIYMIPSGTNLSFVVATNVALLATVKGYDSSGQTNFTSQVSTGSVSMLLTNKVNALTVGTGIRLNPSGGNIIYNATGRPGEDNFQFISAFGNGNNVSIGIGTTQ
jgi:hypothetical protein